MTTMQRFPCIKCWWSYTIHTPFQFVSFTNMLRSNRIFKNFPINMQTINECDIPLWTYLARVIGTLLHITMDYCSIIHMDGCLYKNVLSGIVGMGVYCMTNYFPSLSVFAWCVIRYTVSEEYDQIWSDFEGKHICIKIHHVNECACC